MAMTPFEIFDVINQIRTLDEEISLLKGYVRKIDLEKEEKND